MKKFILLSGCLLTLTAAHSQTFGWAKQLGSTSSDLCRDVAVDAAGNVYSTGNFQGTVDFDPGAGTANLTSAGGTDIYISKFDAAGNYIWALRIGGTTGDERNGITLDAAGNIYLTGYFRGTVDFDPGAGVSTLSNAAGADIFILKLDALGAFTWVKQIGGNSSDHQGNRITVDATGNVYTTGKFVGQIDFDPGAGTVSLGIAASTMAQYYVHVLDASGNYVWAKYLGNSNSTAMGFDIAVNSTGEVYTCGYFESTGLDFDPSAASAVLSSLNYDIFVNKWSSTGTYMWAKKMGGPNNDEALGLVLDASGNVYSTGFFYNTGDFDPSAATANLVSVGAGDIFVSKLSASGTYVWAKRFGGAGDDYGYAMCVDGQGAIYSTGFFNATADFDPGAATANLIAVAGRDAYISKLDASGNYAWGFQLGGAADETGWGIAAAPNGDIYTGGYFSAITDFDPTAGTTNLTPFGSNDIFIQKMNQCLTPGAPTNTTAPAALSFCGSGTTTLTASGTGTMGWYDAMSGGNYLGAGNSYTTATLSVTTTYYVQDSLCAAGTRTAITVTVNPAVNSGIIYTTNLTCAGNNDGSAAVIAANGTAPYSYAWSPSGGNNDIANNLAAGTYTCVITDAAGCTSTQSLTITAPSVLFASNSAQVDVLCFGDASGLLTTGASGGTPSYTYSWSPSGGNAATASGLVAGGYTCTVTDANGCTATQTFNIAQPASALSTSGSFNTDPTCFGGNNGAMGVFAMGGTGAYTYSWSPVAGTSASISGLTAGTYTCVVTDANGCTSSFVNTLSEPAAIDVTTTVGFNSISSNQNGATYQWIDCLNGNQPVAGETNQTFSPTVNGDYAVIVTVGSCSDTSACTNVITGIIGSEAASFNVYPNPTNGLITIQLNASSSNTVIEIFNATGQLVNTEKVTSNSAAVSLPEENGIYLVRVTVDGKSTTKKIVKE